MDIIQWIILILLILITLNLYCAKTHHKIFLIGFRVKTDKNMSVFQLQQEANKVFSLGNWYHEGQSGFNLGVISHVIIFFILLMTLF